MPVDVNSLRRRPAGPRVLVYLDQSTLSALVSDGRFSGVREQLISAVEDGRLVCPDSLEHTAETIGAQASWEGITKLGRQLSMGISFRDEQSLRDHELHAAAALFFNGAADGEVWEEAFETDPHTPRDDMFADGLQVHVYFPPDESRLHEVDNLRNVEERLAAQYEEAWRQGHTFEEQVEREFEAMVQWVLGPLVDGGSMVARAERIRVELVRESQAGMTNIGPGSTYSHLVAAGESIPKVKWLMERFPDVRDRADEFAASEVFRSMPALRYPPIFRAAIATMAGRAPKRGDGHDIVHLTRGLSRCDIVTADASMTQLCLNHRLVPDGCMLLRFNDVEGFSEAIEHALAHAPPAP